MAVVRLTTEGNADAAPVTAAATGATGVNNTTGSMEFDTSWAGLGTVSIQINPAASGANYLFQTVTATNAAAIDMLIRLDATVTATYPLLFMGVGGTRSVAAQVTAQNKLQILNAAGTGVWVSTASIPTDGSTVRVSLYATPGASTGTARAAMFLGESDTPIEDSGLLTGQALNAGGFTQFRWGKAGTANNATVFRIDEPGYDTAASGLIPAQTVTPPSYTATASSTIGVSANTNGTPGAASSATATVGVAATTTATPTARVGVTSLLGVTATTTATASGTATATAAAVLGVSGTASGYASVTGTATAQLTIAFDATAAGDINTIGWYGGVRVIGLNYNGLPVVGLSLGATPLFTV